MSRYRSPSERICQIHAEEACSKECSAECASAWHKRPAIPRHFDPQYGAVCEECARDLAESRGYERHDQAVIAAAFERD